jgi:N-methylhydantoinase A
MAKRLGIDTGGTFTDFVLVDEEVGRVKTAKVPSTPARPADAVAAGLDRLKDEIAPRLDRLVVGTTVATNAIIQRRGPRLVFVTNGGFTDIPFIGRLDKARLYDLNWRKPRPLVRRADSLGVGGRIDAHGDEVEPINRADLARLIDRIAELAAEEEIGVAVCLLFSYAEPAHERTVVDAIRAAVPAAAVSASHEVSPVWREYERASTTLADAFVKPIVEAYVDGVGDALGRISGDDRWNLLGSNGGYLRAETVHRRPVQLVASGLAGGIVGAAFHANVAQERSAFTLDMGGTSCDIGLLIDGEQQYATEFDLAFGQPVSLPTVFASTIGAGGGSIAWIDPGGLLRVGPHSAGAEPGPVAYGAGGTSPTVTDANLVLGRLDPEYFLGGEIELDLNAARCSLAALGDKLGLDGVGAALAIVQTTDENMANAIRLIAVDRGLDPRAFALVAFGGAGPLHARAIAERLEMSTVIIPPSPGLCSAFGAAIARARVDRLRTVSMRSSDLDLERLARIDRALRDEAAAELQLSVEATRPTVRRVAAMRYLGQNYELDVDVPERELVVLA